MIVRDKHSLVWTRKRLPPFLRNCGRIHANNTKCFSSEVLRDMQCPAVQDFHVLIVRDPRDCLVSGAHFFAPRQHIDSYVSKNAEAVVRRVAYRHQLVSMIPDQNSFTMYYEDWMTRPLDITRHLLSFFGVFVDHDTLERIAESVSFDMMRAREKQHRLPGPNRPGAPNRKVRSGTVGGYRHQLQPATIERVTNIMKRVFPDVLLNRYVSI